MACDITDIMKNPRRIFTLKPEDLDRLEKLRVKLGYRFDAQVVRKALRDLARAKLT
jgi:hypothetical protein